MLSIDSGIKILGRLADEGEICYSREESFGIKTKKNGIELFDSGISEGYGIRVIKDKKQGFFFSNKLSKEAIERAVKIAKASEKDKHVSLPVKQSYGNLKFKCHRLSAEEAEKLAFDMLKACKEEKAIPTSGDVSFTETKFIIKNTNGIEGEEESCYSSAYLSAIARNGGEPSTGFYLDISREKKPSCEEVGRTAGKLAVSSLKAEKIKEFKGKVILRPIAVAELFENVLIPSFSAENVQRKRSMLAGKIGERIFDKSLNIIDDASLKHGLMSFSFDGEGVRAQKKKVVEKGVLKSFLYDTYTANKENKKSTGNALRGSYHAMPKIGASNFLLSGNKLESEEDALVINSLIGAHTANSVSGDFSCETRNAFLNGKPVKKAMIYGNIFSCMKEINFGDDYKQFSSVISPSIELGDVSVAG